jgi:hypothetical protein
MRAKGAAFSLSRGHEATVVSQERSVGDTIIEAPPPEGVATRRDVELALRGDRFALTRFAGWNLTEADLNGSIFMAVNSCAAAPVTPISHPAISPRPDSCSATSTTPIGAARSYRLRFSKTAS